MNQIIKLTYAFEAANSNTRIVHTNLKKNAKPVTLCVNTSGLHRELFSKL